MNDDDDWLAEGVTFLEGSAITALPNEAARWAALRDVARAMYPSAALRAGVCVAGKLRGSFTCKTIGRDVRLTAQWRPAN